MSFIKIWVHLVFSTKDRMPFLTKDVRQDVFNHIAQNCKEKEIFLRAINGHLEHAHCLVSLGKEQTISNVAKLIKGESSHWINANGVIKQKFSWQDDYFAVSVGESQLKTIATYIQNQEDHHSRKSFDQEVTEFMNKYGWNIISDK